MAPESLRTFYLAKAAGESLLAQVGDTFLWPGFTIKQLLRSGPLDFDRVPREPPMELIVVRRCMLQPMPRENKTPEPDTLRFVAVTVRSLRSQELFIPTGTTESEGLRDIVIVIKVIEARGNLIRFAYSKVGFVSPVCIGVLIQGTLQTRR